MVGAGPIGLAAIALVRAAGAGRIIAFEPSEGRRELARAMGADEVFDPARSGLEGWPAGRGRRLAVPGSTCGSRRAEPRA